ncbi:DUF1045 domain-containing protein [Paracoccus sp. (in: a-proteobacteria)]|uniref:DUF1045 domain-containing protein n=1 Tax=Paracoccus sp. TaxID=267 RepID=UPI0026DFAF57|nr:DUF1045 domain-containing protein [Paracoccus sp. (in: a-proteobacteria)]MDO5648280.1 DUF1045 domain-containing protein [Paracoccus sp. (in: a-proteobacteria)]
MDRYAIYYVPRAGDFADQMAAWLGWDLAQGRAVAHPVLDLPRPVADLTRSPRRYGFHGTIRAPFRPGDGVTQDAIIARADDLARAFAPLRFDGVELVDLHGFLALTPVGGQGALNDLAAHVVRGTNDLRAPLNDADIARRNPDRLTPHQRGLLDQWGYPFVMDQFRFHLTLTDHLPDAERGAVADALRGWLRLPRPFTIDDLCVVGQDELGRFHLIHRSPLSG